MVGVTIAGWLSPQLRRGGTPYDLAESSMLLYVKEVLPVLKSCIWCAAARETDPPPLEGTGFKLSVALLRSQSSPDKHRLTSTNLNSDAIFCMTSATAANKTGNSRPWQAANAAR